MTGLRRPRKCRSRRIVFDLARQLDIPAVEEDLQPYDFYTADEAFFSQTSFCILPVTRVDTRPVADGKPGPITRQLLAAWSETVGVDIADQAERFGGVSRPTVEIMEATDVAGLMGQSILFPPTVEGWHEGTEWINSGSLIERVNFAAKLMSNVDRPGVRAIIDRLATRDGGEFTPDELVDGCLDLMGPIASNERSRSTLVEHVARQGDLSLRDHQRGDHSEKRVADLLGLIASPREYQLG